MSNLLEIKDLKVCYHTYQGDVRSVRRGESRHRL